MVGSCKSSQPLQRPLELLFSRHQRKGGRYPGRTIMLVAVFTQLMASRPVHQPTDVALDVMARRPRPPVAYH